MYLPRNLIGHLYEHLYRHSHPLSPQVLILVALESDALCACRILTSLFKRDYIGHKIQPISGYDDLAKAGEVLVSKMKKHNGGDGGVVVCLGVGGLVDMSAVLGLEDQDDGVDPSGGIEVWLIDARRPWNLGNVFGGDPQAITGQANGNVNSMGSKVDRGKILQSYKPGQGGIIAWDDGDIEDLTEERDAYCALLDMGDVVDEVGSEESDLEDTEEIMQSIEGEQPNGRKRKSWLDEDGETEQDERPRQRRRSDSVSFLSLLSGFRLTLVEDTLSARQTSPATDSGFRQRSVEVGDEQIDTVQVPSTAPIDQSSQRALRRRFHRERRKYNGVLHRYYSSGSSYSEPISSMLYSLATDQGRDDNELLWHAIVGVSSLELHGRGMTGVGISTSLDAGGSAGWGGTRGETLRQELRDEVHRLNPQDPSALQAEQLRGEATGVIPTSTKFPTDHSIQLSPEPRFLMIRHWSLYESMLHSPYLGSRLHIWNEQGKKRLHKLLAKMGVSLSQCKQNYTHMNMDLKRGLRQRLLTYAPIYGLDGLVPPVGRTREGWGFVKTWGWTGCFSAVDVAVITGAILEISKHGVDKTGRERPHSSHNDESDQVGNGDQNGISEGEQWVSNFWQAYDALENVEALKEAVPIAQHLHRAILRTGTAIIEKRQIRHLKAFRMAVVKEGPDVGLFAHPSALTKLALWVGEAIAEQERDQRGQIGKGGKPTPLVMASLNDSKGVYMVVGTGGGGGVIDFSARARRKARIEEKARRKEAKKAEQEKKRQEKRQAKMAANDDDDEDEEESEEEEEDDDDESDESDEESEYQGYGRNRFGNAFQEVVDETNARVRIDSFEQCVVEVRKEDLSQFLESLSMKAVVG